MNRLKTPYIAFEQKDGHFVHTNPSPLSRISPILVLIIILLAVIFFLAGLFHLLIRFFLKRPTTNSQQPIFHSNRFPENSLSQLRQLFRLHDTGLDQSLIDALPLFRFSDVTEGPTQSSSFDCAVCLCEFSPRDELRLLPTCSHAFHAGCIDTWLLANSSCPLCRRAILIADLYADHPMLIFDDDHNTNNSNNNNNNVEASQPGEGESNLANRVFSIRLGKFASVGSEDGVGEASRCNMDARRCYSMGTCRYVVGEANLQVTMCAKLGKDGIFGDSEGKRISRREKGESFSVSKIWLWSKNSRFPSCSDTDIHLPTSLSASFRGNNQNQSSQMV